MPVAVRASGPSPRMDAVFQFLFVFTPSNCRGQCKVPTLRVELSDADFCEFVTDGLRIRESLVTLPSLSDMTVEPGAMRADNFEVRRSPWALLEGGFAHNVRMRCWSRAFALLLLQHVLLRCASLLVRRLPRELYGSTCCRTGAWIGRRSWKSCSSSMTPRARRSWRRWLVGRRERAQRNQCNRASKLA